MHDNGVDVADVPFKEPMHEYQANLRCILGTFIIGTAGSNLGKVLTMMYVHGGAGFERVFYNSAAFLQRKTINRCRRIVTEALQKEIVLTIEDKMKDKMAEEEMMSIRKKITNGDLKVVDDNIGPAPPAESFDMAWKKRAGGRVYDSLSEHGFLIRCR